MTNPVQRDLFGAGPSKASADARRSLPKQRMTIEPFAFAPGDECEPRGIESIPEWLRFETGEK